MVDKIKNEKILFSEWQRIDIGDVRKKIGLVNIKLDIREFKIELVNCAEIFRRYLDMVSSQYDQICKLKEICQTDTSQHNLTLQRTIHAQRMMRYNLLTLEQNNGDNTSCRGLFPK